MYLPETELLVVRVVRFVEVVVCDPVEPVEGPVDESPLAVDEWVEAVENAEWSDVVLLEDWPETVLLEDWPETVLLEDWPETVLLEDWPVVDDSFEIHSPVSAPVLILKCGSCCRKPYQDEMFKVKNTGFLPFKLHAALN